MMHLNAEQMIDAAEGLSAAKIATTSRGKLDATGSDEAGWAKDRRVDVVLGK